MLPRSLSAVLNNSASGRCQAEIAAVILVFAVGHVLILWFSRGAGQSSTLRNSVASASGRAARVSGLRCTACDQTVTLQSARRARQRSIFVRQQACQLPPGVEPDAGRWVVGISDFSMAGLAERMPITLRMLGFPIVVPGCYHVRILSVSL